MGKWSLNNNVWLSHYAPHEIVDTSPVFDGTLFKQGGLVARWTESYGQENDKKWWYVIKDEPFDILSLKAKRRYEITKGLKNFEVRVIDPEIFAEQIYCVNERSLTAYPEKYRNVENKEDFITKVKQWKGVKHIVIYGAFYKETGQMCGFSMINPHEEWCAFSWLKTDPNYEKYGVNASIVFTILNDLKDKLASGYYLCDGQRNIYHETAFQNYLEKYFGFKKVYCKLKIAYAKKVKWIVKICYAFRKVLYKLDKVGIIHKINSLLKMQEYSD